MKITTLFHSWYNLELILITLLGIYIYASGRCFLYAHNAGLSKQWKCIYSCIKCKRSVSQNYKMCLSVAFSLLKILCSIPGQTCLLSYKILNVSVWTDFDWWCQNDVVVASKKQVICFRVFLTFHHTPAFIYNFSTTAHLFLLLLLYFLYHLPFFNVMFWFYISIFSLCFGFNTDG